MTQEEKQLLLKDLCARLPYGVKVQHQREDYLDEIQTIEHISRQYGEIETESVLGFVDDFKPYLRPMSSMTEEEKREYKHLIAFSGNPIGSANLIDWLNKKMFAYRTIDDKDDKDMFELGLAIKVTEYNNPYD